MERIEPGSVGGIREERFIEQGRDAFVILSKEDSIRLLEQSRIKEAERKNKKGK